LQNRVTVPGTRPARFAIWSFERLEDSIRLRSCSERLSGSEGTDIRRDLPDFRFRIGHEFIIPEG